MKQEENIFKLNDKVFDALLGWGVVIKTTCMLPYSIRVSFDSDIQDEYTPSGYYFDYDLIPRLSFTKYDFVNGGFSQVRPNELPKIGDKVYAWDDNPHNNACIYGVVQEVLPNGKIVINDGHFSNYSIEPPF